MTDLIDLACQNTATSLDAFWAQVDHSVYFDSARMTHYHIVADHIMTFALPDAAWRVLDVGCGPGQQIAELSKRFPNASFMGIDYAASAIEHAQRLCPSADFRVGDILTDDLPDASFDLILCLETLEHITEHEKVLDRMMALLKPGGYLVITVPNGEVETKAVAPWHINFFTRDDVRTMLVQRGQLQRLEFMRDATSILARMQKRDGFKTGVVWANSQYVGPLNYGAHIGTDCLHNIMGLDMLSWPYQENAPETVRDYDCLIVNLLIYGEHVTKAREMNPSAFIIALPDSCFEEAFISGRPEAERQFLRQIQAADAIGYVSESNRSFYSIFEKPMFHIPVAVGTDEFFADMRAIPKQDFIITLDHGYGVNYTMQNVAACAAIQKKTGLQVIYANTGERTPMYAEILGLKADFRPKLGTEEFTRLAAPARFGVDMYALHGVGRTELSLAYAGVPVIGSTYSNRMAVDLKVDPWDVEGAVPLAERLLTDNMFYESTRAANIAFVQQKHSFNAVRRHMQTVFTEAQK